MKLSAAILAVSCSLAYASRDLPPARTPSPKRLSPYFWHDSRSGTPAGADVKPPSAPDASSSKPGSEKDEMPGITHGGPDPTFSEPGYAPETPLFLRQAEGVTTQPPDDMPGRVLEIEQATAGTYTCHVPAGTRPPQKPAQTRPRSQTMDFPLHSQYRQRYKRTKKEFRKTKKQLSQLQRDYQELEMRLQDGSDQESSDDAVKARQKHGVRKVSTLSALRRIAPFLFLNPAGYGDIAKTGVSIPSHGYGVNGCHPIEKPSADSLLQWYECPRFAHDGTEDGTVAVAETDMR